MSSATTASPAIPLEKFNPWQILNEIAAGEPTWTKSAQSEVAEASIEVLRDLNKKWFANPMGFKQAVAMLVLINEEFTRRGIGPAWRSLPRNVATPRGDGPRLSLAGSVMLLGGAEKKRHLLRWIDLQWLRAELGPTHIAHSKLWTRVFSEDDRVAFPAINYIAAARWKSGKVKAPTIWKTVRALLVPRAHRRALCGFMARDEGEATGTIKKRLETRIAPRLGALLDDPRQRLTQGLIQKRLLYAEAIELAEGSPTEAVRFYRWMTGETITRASMHEMKIKTAAQCSLKTMAWQSQR